MTNYLLTIGIPGCGKTTQLNSFCEGRKSTRVSSDDFIESEAITQGKTYNQIWEQFPEKVSAAQSMFWKKLEDVTSDRESKWDIVVIDRTNMHNDARKKIIDVIRRNDPDAHIVAVLFPLPKDEKEEWHHEMILKSRKGKEISNGVLRSMKRSYRAPEKNEGFDSIVTLTPSYVMKVSA